MSENKKENTGLILWLSQQSLPIRFAAYIVFVVLAVVFIVGATGGLYYLNVSNFPRLEPAAVADNVTVAEYVTFDDEEAYPAAVASAMDGTLYTGSYVHGTIWRVNPTGDMIEIPQTRDLIGSVIGIDIASDGRVYVLDHLEAFSAGGAKIWQIADNTVELLWDTTLDSEVPISKPNDIAVDASGRVYVLDIELGRIVALDENGLSIWWTASTESQIAGLAYDPMRDALLVTDAAFSAVYAIPVSVEDRIAETLFINDTLSPLPAFNGIAVDENGTFYVAAFDLNEIWQIIPNTNEYTVLANNYRGSSDVAYDMSHSRLFVNNWDQSWLIPVSLVVIDVDVPPRLPFSVDVINLGDQ